MSSVPPVLDKDNAPLEKKGKLPLEVSLALHEKTLTEEKTIEILKRMLKEYREYKKEMYGL